MKFKNFYIVLPLLALAGCFGCPNKQTNTASEVPYTEQKDQCKDLSNSLEQAQREIEKLKRELGACRDQHALRDPTWEELRTFINDDQGGSKPFIDKKYNCENFAIALRDAARERGFNASFVSIEYKGDGTGHAINAFETPDYGRIYVEPQGDNIAYLKAGKPYATIPIASVKRRYLVCPKTPSDLINGVQAENYQGNIFEYEYFEDYKARVACYTAALDAYNSAVEDFNNGFERYKSSEIRSWSKHLKQLSEDIGNERSHTRDSIVADFNLRG